MNRFLVSALLFACPAGLSAQHRGAGQVTATHPPGAHFGHRGSHGRFFPVALYDPFYSDYFSSSGSPAASEPPVIIVQSPKAAPVAEPSPIPAQPLMIELQGDRYVQVSGEDSSRSQMIDESAAMKPARSRLSISSAVRANNLREPSSSVVLIFRDGRRQEVSSYTIADGILYASSDYATTGAWNQKVELSALDISETFASNSSRGVRFQLPSAPNEVIVGP
jgi:hypothetical protein